MKPYYDFKGMTLYSTDVATWARDYDGPKFHALLTDAPYEYGFMGRSWDARGVSFQPETWKALTQHLHPGAFGMVCMGARTVHRAMVAIEDAGLIIHPVLFGWAYGSGFPKATRIDTAVDKAAGAERQIVGKLARPGSTRARTAMGDGWQPSPDITAPATDLAADWQGHRYGLQALKPALEPIIVFQKPYQGRPVECITATGAGALWIDGGRIGANGGGTKCSNRDEHGRCRGHDNAGRSTSGQTIHGPDNDAGRWPANLVLMHAPACNGSCVDGCPVKALGEQSGESISRINNRGEAWGYSGLTQPATVRGIEGAGTAARYFQQIDWSLDVAEQIAMADPVRYEAKASSAERDAGLSAFGETTISDGRKTPIDNAYQRGETTRLNPHPTVKPIGLARYLATLLLPPLRYAPRRLLVPFAGVGSEMAGAGLAGWEEVMGIEREAEYAPVNEARVHHWVSKPQQRGLFDESEAA